MPRRRAWPFYLSALHPLAALADKLGSSGGEIEGRMYSVLPSPALHQGNALERRQQERRR